MAPRRPFELGPFRVEPVRVSHSITDACALVLRTPAGTLVHTGDFKLDPSPPDGEPTDLERLGEVGREGVRLLLSDSTNIDAPGESGGEASVGAALERLVRSAAGRVVVGLFPSNVQRLRMLGELARRARRRICLLGRSVHTHVRAASQCARLEWPSDLVIPGDQAQACPRAELMVLASGTQAEPLAALSRLAARVHPVLTLDPGDLLVLSSRIIPGNDPAVFRMVGNFIRQGVVVHSRITDPAVHVSGHAHRDEQRAMIELVRPRGFVPVHGTLHHLKRHADFARELGVPEVLLAEDGDVVTVGADGLRKTDFTMVGKVATYDGEEIPEEVLREREALGRAGIAVVTVTVDARGQLLAAPVVSTRGVLDEGEDTDLLRAAAVEVGKALDGRPFHAERPTDEQIVEVAQRAVRRNLDGITGSRPVTVVHVVRA
jgi:ribonuclease J